MKKIILIILSIVMLQKNLQAANEEKIPIKPHAWLELLSTEEQRVALVTYQIALAKKVENVRIAAKNDNDRMWGLKIFACGHLFAAQSATKNKDQREALTAITTALRDGIAGNGNADSRIKKLREAELMGEQIANSIPDSLANNFQKKYAAESNKFNTEFIVAAMGCASESNPLKENITCSPKGIDVCKMARKMADETALMLPMRLNKNLSVQTIASANNSITMVAKFEYNKASLHQSLTDTNMSNSEMLKIMHEHARSAMCTANTPTKSFIDSGGVINYQYRFNDGSMYTNVHLTSCA